MSTRISSAVVLALSLAACQPAGQDGNDATDAGQAADAGRIDCAPAGASTFTRRCTIDRVAGDGGLMLVVHNPDGGFHRLRVTDDGRGVVAADGAQQAKVSIVGKGMIDVAIGNDRYRLPATIERKGGAAS